MDEERVTDLFGRLMASGVELDDRELDAIANLLAAVRLDERRAIAAFLRKRGSDPHRSATGTAALHEAADAVEHEEHAS